MTTKVHDGTYWNDKNILYLHYGAGSVIINIYQNPSKYMSGILLYVHYISIKLIFKKKAKAIYLRDPEVIITSIHAIQHMHIIIKDIMFVVRTEI